MSNENIDKVYIILFICIKDIVEKILKLKLLEIEEKEVLREISFGDFEGRIFEEIKIKYLNEFEKMIKEGNNYRYLNGESLIDFYKRVVKEIDNIILENDSNLDIKIIFICFYVGIIRNIIIYLIFGSYKYYWNFKIDNVFIIVLEIDGGFVVIDKMNFIDFI